eukprot:TRINITY_DN3814_c0_g1_i1.p1 TRINITY_DN3814_c0_g1~~TRINITY_DN3814_c0_g1_i1.p1  ORF type:complete len:220 (-),score=50.14 TRINITY_DN3814_c0_g1_i1:862-1521(-)
MSEELEDISLVLFSCENCFIYKLPILPVGTPHRADDWGIDKPLSVAKIQIVGHRNTTEIQIMSKTASVPWACSNMADFVELKQLIEPVSDSSRFFCVIVKDFNTKTKKSRIGLGFAEREEAEKFKIILADQYKRQSKESADTKSTESEFSSLSLKPLSGAIRLHIGESESGEDEPPLPSATINSEDIVIPTLQLKSNDIEITPPPEDSENDEDDWEDFD